jgi:hypothetical protein
VPRSANFDRKVVTIPAGRSHQSAEHEWTDALVIVATGEIEIECSRGGRRRFDCGSVLWLAGLEVRAIHSRGTDDATLVAVSRRRGPPPPRDR